MSYQILTAGTIGHLGNMVHEALRFGWEVSGGPFVFNGQVCQAMIKRS